MHMLIYIVKSLALCSFFINKGDILFYYLYLVQIFGCIRIHTQS